MDFDIGSGREMCPEQNACIDTVVKYQLSAPWLIESACAGLTRNGNTLHYVNHV